MKSSSELYSEATALGEQKAAKEAEAHQQRLRELRAKPLLERLIFAAYNRCPCGAGLAYDPAGESGGYKEDGGDADAIFKGSYGGYWDCSAIILGTAINKGEPGAVQHVGKLPFSFYEIKSENQPSAYGATTRPQP